MQGRIILLAAGGDMSTSEVQAQRDSSRRRNEDVLTTMGFRRVASTSIFQNVHGVALLSPGVGQSWFDLRQVNLDRLDDSLAGVVLRFSPDGYAVIPMLQLRPHLKTRTVRSTKGGPTFGFRCRLDRSAGTVHLTASSDHTTTFSTRLLNREGVAGAVTSLLSGSEQV